MIDRSRARSKRTKDTPYFQETKDTAYFQETKDTAYFVRGSLLLIGEQRSKLLPQYEHDPVTSAVHTLSAYT